MSRFFAEKLVALYEPANPSQATPAAFAGYLEKCQGCRHRLKGRCRLTGQQVSLMARVQTPCPLTRRQETTGEVSQAGASRTDPLLPASVPAGPVQPLVRPQSRPLVSMANRSAPFRFVTTITERFVPGMLALLQSMKDNAGIPFRFHVVTYVPDPKWDRPITDQDRQLIEAMDVPITWHHPDDLGGEFPFDRSLTDSKRMAANIDKPLVWRLPFDDLCCYTDTDVLCLSNLAAIRDFPSLTVVAQGSCLGKTDPDWDTRYRPSGMWPFNAGWFVYRPDAAIYAEMVDYAQTYTDSVAFGDQVPLNDFMAASHPESINYVGMEWNLCTWTLATPHAANFPLEKVKLLHYAGPKPWADPIAQPYQEKPWALWRHYYSRALQHLRRKGVGVAVKAKQHQRFVVPSFDYRADLGLYLNRLGLTGEGAEIGVYKGAFSRQILKHWRGKKLWLVDRQFAEKPKLPRSELIEADSVAAAGLFADGSLDFVYIDAAHNYDDVMADLAAWYPKVRAGGLFCGHDYQMSWTPDVIGNQPIREEAWGGDYREMPFGVKQAVNDFCGARGLTIHTTTADEIGSPSWFALKEPATSLGST